jgi:hypothetical protein
MLARLLALLVSYFVRDLFFFFLPQLYTLLVFCLAKLFGDDIACFVCILILAKKAPTRIMFWRRRFWVTRAGIWEIGHTYRWTDGLARKERE